MQTPGLLFVTPDGNYFLADRIFISADENKFSADGNFVSPDVIEIISPSRRTVSPKPSD